MVIRRIFDRCWVRYLGVAGIAAGGYLAGLTTDRVVAEQPTKAPLPSSDKRIVAVIYGNVAVTREELGDYLINRGGSEKLELLVNKKIIEIEAARRNISITSLEVEAALSADVRSLEITLKDFQEHVLPRYHKTLYEWKEDVIKPRLLIGKMCQNRIKVTEDDIRRAYENDYGDKRQPKIICWGQEDERIAIKQWDEARKGDAEFDEIARHQKTPALASGCGLIAPIGRFPDVEDETCTKELYKLQKVGDITGLIQTPAGIMCMKLYKIIPAQPPYCKVTDQSLAALKNANLPDAVLAKLGQLKNKELTRQELIGELGKLLPAELMQTQTQELILFHTGDVALSYDKVRATLEHKVYDKKLSAETPRFFTELKKEAQPNLLLKGVETSDSEIRGAAEQNIQELQQGGVLPGGTAPRKP